MNLNVCVEEERICISLIERTSVLIYLEMNYKLQSKLQYHNILQCLYVGFA